MEAYVLTHLLAVAFMFSLAGWLLWLDFGSSVNRAFALFLFLRGMANLSNRMADLGGAEWYGFWTSIWQYFFLALPLALSYFLLVHLGPRSRGRALLALALLGAAVAAEAAFLLDHCLSRCVEAEGSVRFGPLYLLGALMPMIFALAGIALARHGASLGSPARRGGPLLLASAFLLEAILVPSIVVGILVRRGWAPFAPGSILSVNYLMLLAAFVLALAGVILLVRAALRHGGRRLAGALAGLMALACVVGVLQGSVPFALRTSALLLVGLLLMVPPALVAYAVLRHSLFDVDVKVKWTLAKAPAAVIALATFFIVTQIAETYFSTSLGAIAGGLMTGILVLALSPLHTIGQRLADGVMPGTKPISAMSHPERVELYRTQAVLAWNDGWLAAKERLLLDHLRERLGLTLEEAVHLEREAMSAENPFPEGGAA